MRPPVPRLVWGYVVCLLLALGYCGRCFLVATGIGRDRESEAAFAEYWQGHRCVDAGEYLAAIPHYDVWRDLLRRRGKDDSEVAGSIAYCWWRGGKVDEALSVFDASLARNLRWEVAVDKALCLAERDAASALAWLQKQPLPPTAHHCALARFHRLRREFVAAIQSLEALLREFDGDRFFDAADQLVGADLPLSTDRHNELVRLLDPLTDLAECHFRLDHLEQAERLARRGVAVGRRYWESKGYASSGQIAAADGPCRLWLARVAMARQAWPEAAVHIAHARLLADRGSHSEDHRQMTAVAAELERLRAGR